MNVINAATAPAPSEPINEATAETLAANAGEAPYATVSHHNAAEAEAAPNPAPNPAAESEPEAPAEEAPAEEPEAEETVDWEARLREAEQRGYLRGRNEAVELAMRESAMWEQPGGHRITPAPAQAPSQAQQQEASTRFLSQIRPSCWD